MTLKITTSNPDYADTVLHELDINERITEQKSRSGFGFVRAAFDHFMAVGPDRTFHLCLALRVCARTDESVSIPSR